MKILIGPLVVLAFIALIGFGVWWEVYKYHDCRNVGHAKLYCIMKIGG